VLPQHPDEFIVMAPLVVESAAFRLFEATAESLREFFCAGLYPPVSILHLQPKNPLQGIFSPRPLLLIAEDPGDFTAIFHFKTYQAQFAARVALPQFRAGWTENRMGMNSGN
jgi:hypothetical protein